MGLFGKTKELPFVSNGRLIEVINQNDAYLDEGIEEKKSYKALERQLERRFLYRNVESITPTGTFGIVIVKYKDLKVRSEAEVAEMRRQLRKEAGLEWKDRNKETVAKFSFKTKVKNKWVTSQ